jgi:uncharacterized membrane protein
MMWNHRAGGFHGFFAIGVLILLFFVLLAAVVMWLVHGLRSGSGQDGRESAPLARADEVLAERFANGEIDAAEFKLRREVLQSIRQR